MQHVAITLLPGTRLHSAESQDPLASGHAKSDVLVFVSGMLCSARARGRPVKMLSKLVLLGKR